MGQVIRTVQWNIGGGKVREPSADVNALASYNIDGMSAIIDQLQKLAPDIITLQEAHANTDGSQVEQIARALGSSHFVADSYDDSHIEKGQRLSQGIISRFPISDHDFRLFTNPQYEVVWEDGSKAFSHDKGVTSCVVHIGQTPVTVKTLHSVPFRRFGIELESDSAQAVLLDMQTKLQSDAERFILQGDFNLNFVNLDKVLPVLLADNLSEVPQSIPTTPKGRMYDHVLFRGVKLQDSRVVKSVLTDHFPVVTTFEI